PSVVIVCEMLCCLTGATCTETSGCGSASFLEEHPASKTTGKNNRTRRVWRAKWDNLDGLVCVIRLEQLLLPWRPVKAQLHLHYSWPNFKAVILTRSDRLGVAELIVRRKDLYKMRGSNLQIGTLRPHIWFEEPCDRQLNRTHRRRSFARRAAGFRMTARVTIFWAVS